MVFCTKTCCEWLWKQECILKSFFVSFNLAMRNPPVEVHLSQLPMKETLDVCLSREVKFRERNSGVVNYLFFSLISDGA